MRLVPPFGGMSFLFSIYFLLRVFLFPPFFSRRPCHSLISESTYLGFNLGGQVPVRSVACIVLEDYGSNVFFAQGGCRAEGERVAEDLGGWISPRVWQCHECHPGEGQSLKTNISVAEVKSNSSLPSLNHLYGTVALHIRTCPSKRRARCFDYTHNTPFLTWKALPVDLL
ncbi:hypothetical protein VTJ04DRAFT_2627 [Mycothermus thermophilus]|uniref:uncharacterized protein n=1 Tax=Humicola insolens TaxID=85995 RepID=UPI0037438DCF